MMFQTVVKTEKLHLQQVSDANYLFIAFTLHQSHAICGMFGSLSL